MSFLRRRGRLALLAFGLALPLTVVAGIEIALRAAGVGERPAALVTTSLAGRSVLSRGRTLEAVPADQQAKLDRIYLEDDAENAENEEQPLRIVVVGESTAAGFPFHPYFSFGRVLESLLHEAAPATELEVVNLGKAADSSREVRDTVEELLARARVDLLIVCSGHNELLVPYCDELRSTSRGPGAWLGRLRLVSLLRVKGEREPSLASRAPRPLAGRRIGDEPFLDDATRRRGLERFVCHLSEITALAARQGARVLFLTQASNLRDFAPSYSCFRRRLEPREIAEYESLVAEIPGLLEDPVALGACLDRLEELDPDVAFTRFHRARWHELRGEPERAAPRYAEALSLDQYPNRASLELNEAIRELGRTGEGEVLDLAAVLRGLAKAAQPGRDLFLDHCHPTVDATFRIARALLPRVCSLLPELRDAEIDRVPRFDRAGDVDAWLGRLGLDRAFLASRTLGAARLNLLAYLESPASRDRLELARAAYEVVLGVDPGHAEGHAGLAVVWLCSGDADRALAEAEEAVKLDAEALDTLEVLARSNETLATALEVCRLGLTSGRLIRLEPE